MKKFTIEYHGWESLIGETGNDFVFFKGSVYTDEELQQSFPVSIPMRMIENQIESDIPSGETIIQQIKKRTTGWGPQESAITKELEECGIDLEVIFKKTIETKIDLEAEAERWKNLEAHSEELQAASADLDETVAELKVNNDQYYQLCSLLEKAITDEVVTKFPVLLNSSSEYIRKLQEIIIDHIPDLAEDLNDLIWEAKDEES